MKKGIIQNTCVIGSLLLLSLSGCKSSTRVEPVDPSEKKGDVEFTIDWSKIHQGEESPKIVKAYFYPKTGGDPTIVEIKEDKISQKFPSGFYDILVFNEDDENVAFQNMDKFDTAEAVVKYFHTRADDEPTPTPKNIYIKALHDKIIPEDGTIKEDITPEPLTRRFSFTIKIDKHKDAINGCEIILTGMASSVNLSTRKFSEPEDIKIYPQSCDDEINLFSFSPVKGDIKEVSIIINFKSGGKQIFTKDITDIMDDETVLDIDIETDITIVEISTNEFTASVKEWTIEERTVDVE